MTAPVALAQNEERTRAAFRLWHAKGNIITAETISQLSSGLAAVGANPHLKLITLEGAGQDFSFGASVPEHGPVQIGSFLPAMNRLILELLEAPAVTAAVVRGRCLGGGFELALACDFIFAADDAVFGLPEIALGVFPPAGAALLPAKTCAAQSLRAIITGESQPASHWRTLGLIDLMAPASSLDSVIDSWFAKHLAPRSAAALKYAATAARMSLVAHVRRTLPQLERLYLDRLMRTSDAVEGIAAFLERRPPRWTDR